MNELIKKLISTEDKSFIAQLMVKLIENKEFQEVLEIKKETQFDIYSYYDSPLGKMSVFANSFLSNNEEFLKTFFNPPPNSKQIKSFFKDNNKLLDNLLEKNYAKTIKVLHDLGILSLMQNDTICNESICNNFILKAFLYAKSPTLDLIVESLNEERKNSLKVFKLSLFRALRDENKYIENFNPDIFLKPIIYFDEITQEIIEAKKDEMLDLALDTTLMSMVMKHKKILYPLTLILLDGSEASYDLIKNQLPAPDYKLQTKHNLELYDFISKNFMTNAVIMNKIKIIMEKEKILLEKDELECLIENKESLSFQKWKI